HGILAACPSRPATRARCAHRCSRERATCSLYCGFPGREYAAVARARPGSQEWGRRRDQMLGSSVKNSGDEKNLSVAPLRNMGRSFRLVVVLAMLLADISGAAQVGTPTLVSIQTPRGATQAFILIEVDNPVASVILITGGHGALGLKSASSMKWGSEGFLVRS